MEKRKVQKGTTRNIKKKNISKSKKAQIIKLKRRKKNRNRLILSVIAISILVVGINRFHDNIPTITTEEINSFIDEADKYSRDKAQLNWKEMASINVILSTEDFKVTDENIISEISNAMYIDDTTERRSFEETLDELMLTDKQKNNAKEILNSLQDVSLRKKYNGEDISKDEFIHKLIEPSKKCYEQYGILPSVVIGQAILESQWGTSELAARYNNYYGIKADSSWNGAICNYSTKENYNDVIKANFRAYSTIEESVLDLGAFINNNSRYRENGFFNGKNYVEQAEALERAGYATKKDENGTLIYADLLIQIIRENNLMLLDSEV